MSDEPKTTPPTQPTAQTPQTPTATPETKHFWRGAIKFLFSNHGIILVSVCVGLYFLLQFLLTDNTKAGLCGVFALSVTMQCISEENFESLKKKIKELQSQVEELKKG